jgi:hypothetical protein
MHEKIQKPVNLCKYYLYKFERFLKKNKQTRSTKLISLQSISIILISVQYSASFTFIFTFNVSYSVPTFFNSMRISLWTIFSCKQYYKYMYYNGYICHMFLAILTK